MSAARKHCTFPNSIKNCRPRRTRSYLQQTRKIRSIRPRLMLLISIPLVRSNIIGPAMACGVTGKCCTSGHSAPNTTAPPSPNHFLHPDLDNELSLLRSYMIMARLKWLFLLSIGERDARRIRQGYLGRGGLDIALGKMFI